VRQQQPTCIHHHYFILEISQLTASPSPLPERQPDCSAAVRMMLPGSSERTYVDDATARAELTR
jgi:hypothetical protein